MGGKHRLWRLRKGNGDSGVLVMVKELCLVVEVRTVSDWVISVVFVY